MFIVSVCFSCSSLCCVSGVWIGIISRSLSWENSRWEKKEHPFLLCLRTGQATVMFLKISKWDKCNSEVILFLVGWERGWFKRQKPFGMSHVHAGFAHSIEQPLGLDEPGWVRVCPDFMCTSHTALAGWVWIRIWNIFFHWSTELDRTSRGHLFLSPGSKAELYIPTPHPGPVLIWSALLNHH